MHMFIPAVLGTLLIATVAVAQSKTPEAPKLEFAFEVRAKVAVPTVVGQVPGGTRRIVDVLGGTL